MITKRIKWTDEKIESELIKTIGILGLERMPTAGELKTVGRNDLHCKISRTRKYTGWASRLGLKTKGSTSETGRTYELEAARILSESGYSVELTSAKHPYDLLINGALKVDVKAANAYMLRGKNRIHTFRLSKTDPTCDIYICFLIDEEKKVERLLIIPSHHVRKTMLNIGFKSKYDVYKDRFDYIKKYTDFFSGVL